MKVNKSHIGMRQKSPPGTGQKSPPGRGSPGDLPPPTAEGERRAWPNFDIRYG